jgi:hypothetical protein
VAGIHVLYSYVSLQWLAVCVVSAEMVNWKQLSTSDLDFDPAPDPDPPESAFIWLSWIRIWIYNENVDPDPNPEAWKLTEFYK